MLLHLPPACLSLRGHSGWKGGGRGASVGSLSGGGLWDQQIFVMILKVQDDGVQCQTTTVVTHHSLKDCQCTHTNIVKVISTPLSEDHIAPDITTSIIEQSYNILVKLTQVNYRKNKYIIEDRYLFNYSPSEISVEAGLDSSVSSDNEKPKQDDQSIKRENSDENNKERKVCFFHKRLNNGKTLLKRNTKNLPKNFFKGFLSFIQARNLGENSEVIMRELRGLNVGVKYNNILIQKMLSNSIIAPYFKQFLQNHAEDWIKSSKINDKIIHLEAIPIYLSLFDKFAYAEEDNYWSDQ